MQRTKADSSGLEGFGPQQKRLIDLLEECTPKDQPCVQQSLLKEVKDILRAGNDEDVRVTFDTLMGRLGNVHAQVRMLALQVVADFAGRSKLFRKLLAGHMNKVLLLCVGHRLDTPLPGPPTCARALRDAALDCVRVWHEKYGKQHPQMTSAYRYLRDTLGHQYPEIAARAIARDDAQRSERRRAAEEARRQLVGMAPKLAVLQDTADRLLVQMDECLALLSGTANARPSVQAADQPNTAQQSPGLGRAPRACVGLGHTPDQQQQQQHEAGAVGQDDDWEDVLPEDLCHNAGATHHPTTGSLHAAQELHASMHSDLGGLHAAGHSTAQHAVQDADADIRKAAPTAAPIMLPLTLAGYDPDEYEDLDGSAAASWMGMHALPGRLAGHGRGLPAGLGTDPATGSAPASAIDATEVHARDVALLETLSDLAKQLRSACLPKLAHCLRVCVAAERPVHAPAAASAQRHGIPRTTGRGRGLAGAAASTAVTAAAGAASTTDTAPGTSTANASASAGGSSSHSLRDGMLRAVIALKAKVQAGLAKAAAVGVVTELAPKPPSAKTRQSASAAAGQHQGASALQGREAGLGQGCASAPSELQNQSTCSGSSSDVEDDGSSSGSANGNDTHAWAANAAHTQGSQNVTQGSVGPSMLLQLLGTSAAAADAAGQLAQVAAQRLSKKRRKPHGAGGAAAAAASAPGSRQQARGQPTTAAALQAASARAHNEAVLAGAAAAAGGDEGIARALQVAELEAARQQLQQAAGGAGPSSSGHRPRALGAVGAMSKTKTAKLRKLLNNK